MDAVIKIVSQLPELPLTHLLVIVALAMAALAGFALYVVLKIAQGRGTS